MHQIGDLGHPQRGEGLLRGFNNLAYCNGNHGRENTSLDFFKQ